MLPSILRAARPIQLSALRQVTRTTSNVLPRFAIAASRTLMTSPVRRNDGETRTYEERQSRNSDRHDRSSFRKERSPPSKILFIGNLPYTATSADLEPVFEQFGKVLGIRLATDFQNSSRGYAHVEFESLEDASAVVEAADAEPLWLNNRALRIDFAAQARAPVRDPNNRLFFTGCADEEALREMLKPYEGGMRGIMFLDDPYTGGRSNRGFVTFKSVSYATEAKDALNPQLKKEGNSMQLEYANPRPRFREQRQPFKSSDSRPKRFQSEY